MVTTNNDEAEFYQAVLAGASTVMLVASTLKANYNDLTPDEIREGKRHISNLVEELKRIVDESEYTDDKLRGLMDKLHEVGADVCR